MTDRTMLQRRERGAGRGERRGGRKRKEEVGRGEGGVKATQAS